MNTPPRRVTRRLPLVIAALMALADFALTAFLQQGGQYKIKPSVVAGGGGTSTGSAPSLSGTIGQTALGIARVAVYPGSNAPKKSLATC